MAHDEQFREECLHWWCVQTPPVTEPLVLKQGRCVQHCSNMAHYEQFMGEGLHWWCVPTSLRAELLVLQQGRRVQHCSNFWTDYLHSGPHSVPDPVPDRSRPIQTRSRPKLARSPRSLQQCGGKASCLYC